MWRLPLSMPLARRLQAAARRAGFSALAGRIADWRARYGRIDPAAWTGCARRRRCVIVGNGPSLARLPLSTRSDRVHWLMAPDRVAIGPLEQTG
jgi:hypothetical protein